MDHPLISVCVPIYNGAEYVQETLERIYNQTYKNLEILISIDLSTDNTFEICKKLANPKTTLFLHNSRLGWVKNCNFLISKSNGKYFSIIPHDDLIPSNYFEKLLEGFEKHPAAINCFPYIQSFGNSTSKIYQKSITGTLKERVQDVINNHFDGVSFRGLIRRDLPDDLLYLCTDQHQNIMADSIWILQHAIVGEMYSIDVEYHKRYHKTNEHSAWIHKPLDDKLAAWVQHCATLYNITKKYVDDKEVLYNYCVDRLLYKKKKLAFIPADKINHDLINKFDEKINK